MPYYIAANKTLGHCGDPSPLCKHEHYYYLASAARELAAQLPKLSYHIAADGEIEQCHGEQCAGEHFLTRKEIVKYHRETYDFSGKWRPLQNPYVSLLERELSEFIGRLGYRVVTNSRKVIAPYEIDLYLPDVEIALEFNGDHWHSEEQIKRRYGMTPRDYHHKKLQKCDEIGIKLGFIWESNWQQDWITCIDAICDFIQFRRSSEILSQLDKPLSPAKFFWEGEDRGAANRHRGKIERRMRKAGAVPQKAPA